MQIYLSIFLPIFRLSQKNLPSGSTIFINPFRLPQKNNFNSKIRVKELRLFAYLGQMILRDVECILP